jgi:tRNA dimethylallyltransferase
LVGGTGLYFQALVEGLVKIPNIPIKYRNKIRLMQKKEGQKKFYKKLIKLDPKIKNEFDKNDVQRSIRAYEIKKYTKISMYKWISKTKPIFDQSLFLKLYLNIERESLLKRIEKRTSEMINIDAINEAKKVLKIKIKKDHSILKVIGLKELTKYLNNEIDLNEAREQIIIKTRQYAKRQSTWARSRMINWTKIDPNKLSLNIKK